MKLLKNWWKIHKSKNVIEQEEDGRLEFIYKPKSLNSEFSGNQLKIISASPKFEPTKESQRSVVKYLANVFPHCEISSFTTSEIQFIDPGGNLDSINCNKCGQTLEGEAWQQAMDSAYQNCFTDLSYRTECCDEITNLNDLIYNMSAGFSKYVIVINEPEVQESEIPEILKKVMELLGQDLKFIWAHY